MHFYTSRSEHSKFMWRFFILFYFVVQRMWTPVGPSEPWAAQTPLFPHVLSPSLAR